MAKVRDQSWHCASIGAVPGRCTVAGWPDMAGCRLTQGFRSNRLICARVCAASYQHVGWLLALFLSLSRATVAFKNPNPCRIHQYATYIITPLPRDSISHAGGNKYIPKVLTVAVPDGPSHRSPPFHTRSPCTSWRFNFRTLRMQRFSNP